MDIKCRCDYCKESLEPIGEGGEVPEGWISLHIFSSKGMIGKKDACPSCIEGFGNVLSVRVGDKEKKDES